MLCTKFDRNWSSGSDDSSFELSVQVNYLCHLVSSCLILYTNIGVKQINKILPISALQRLQFEWIGLAIKDVLRNTLNFII